MEETKTLESFAKALADKLKSTMATEYELDVLPEFKFVHKTNGLKPALIIRIEGCTMPPSLQLQPLYENYLRGTDIDYLAAKMGKEVYNTTKLNPEIPTFSIEEARRRVRLAMISTKRNEDLLKTVPRFEVADMSAVPKWYISSDEIGSSSLFVSKQLAAIMGLTSDEILQMAHDNTLKQKFEIKSLSDMLQESMISEGMPAEMAKELVPDGIIPAYVVTTEDRLDGASCMLNPKVMEELRQKLTCDHENQGVILLPSSRHEIIALAETDDMNPEFLCDMVRQINDSTVSYDDYLSDTIMKWDGNRLALAFPEPEMETPVVEAPQISMKMGGF